MRISEIQRAKVVIATVFVLVTAAVGLGVSLGIYYSSFIRAGWVSLFIACNL